MEENNPKKSKALIITIILLLLLFIVGYLLFKNKEFFGVKTSSSISRIFSSLTTSENSKNLNKIEAQAGEDIKEGDAVYAFGTNAENKVIVMKVVGDNRVLGYANQDIVSGAFGEISIDSGSGNFWDSFSGFIDDFFGDNTVPGENSCANDADNFPLCTTIDGECINEGTNPPLCTTIDDSCIDGAINPPECTILPDGCDNGAINPPECTIMGEPDLIVTGDVNPTTVTINTPIELSAMIINVGRKSTEHSFSTFFSIDDGTKIDTIVSVVPTLEPGIGNSVTVLYTFTSLKDYSVQVCTDKDSSSDEGTVTESNEDNNCGPLTTIKVSNSLPLPGLLPQCSDTVDNDNDGLIDKFDPNCYIDGDIEKDYIPDHTSEMDSPKDPEAITPTPGIDPITPPNVCLDIEKNPLTFTDAEKAELTELLRKFYLLAPTLKTSDDISLVYSDITQHQNFSDQLSVLTKECYATTSSPSYTGPTARYGNPWYRYDLRDSYLGTGSNNTQTTYACYGTVTEDAFGIKKGQSCSIFTNSTSCEGIVSGCYWMDQKEYEKILNIW